MEQVKLYDTTLRDGMGGQGMSLSVGEKVKVVRALDELGVHFIEAGFPSSNPKEAELFERLAELELEQATICAFGMTRRRGLAAEEDEALRTLVDSFAPVVSLVGKTWVLHLEKVTRVSREENLAMIADSVGFCREQGKRGDLRRRALLRRLPRRPRLRARMPAGRGRRPAPRTSPSATPTAPACRARSPRRPPRSSPSSADEVEIGIHTHNDAECGVANSLAAVEAGARLVQGSVNGYGERCGNANLASILPALQLKMGFEVVTPEQLAALTPTAHFLDELCNVASDPDRAYVGRNAFAHKAGMHVAGVAADARTFEHLDPALVGNERDVLPSELSGKATIRSQAERAGLELDDEAAARAVERLKEREHRGYHYEAAPASFELLLRREAGSYKPLFKLESFRVVTEKRAGGEVETEATIKVEVDGERYVRVAEGNGPVNALDRALRGAIADRYPHLAEIELTNYKVRILDEAHGTGAVTRVLLDSADGEPRVGHDRRLREHHRGLLGGAGRLAGVRLPVSARDRADPARPAGDRRARGGAGARGAALGPALAGADGRALRARVRRLARGRGRGRGLQRHHRPAPRGAGARLGRGRRGPDQPLQLRRLGQLPALRGRPAGLLRRRPGDAQPRPRRPPRRRSASAPRASCRSTSSATRRRCRSWRRSPPSTGSGSSRTPARRSARSTPRAARSAPAATSPPSPSTPTSR